MSQILPISAAVFCFRYDTHDDADQSDIEKEVNICFDTMNIEYVPTVPICCWF